MMLIALATAACQQHASTPAAKDTAHADTVLKTDSVSQSPATGDATVVENLLIVPGKSVGQTTINEADQSVYKRLGKPDAADAAMGKSMATWYAKHDTTGYQTQIFFSRNMGNDDTARVKQIRITSPAFKTGGRKGVGTSLADLQADHNLKKVASFTDHGDKYDIYDDDKAGISFELNDKSIATAVIVHKPGSTAGGTYLPFIHQSGH